MIKKLFAVFLIAALLLSGCSSGSRTLDEDRAQLTAILNDISENMRPATAGSSLTSARLAADLISWATTTKMSKSEIADIVMNWLKEQSPEIRAAFQEKLSNVQSSVESIVRDGAAGLLESVGVEKDFSNLGTRFQELVQAVLASGGVDKK